MANRCFNLGVFSAIVAILLTFIAPATVTQGNYDAETAQFLVLLNAYRAQHGAPALAVDVSLQAAANWMTADMLEHNYLAHTDNTGRDAFARMRAFGYPAYSNSTSTLEEAGENAGYGPGSSLETAEQVLKLWQSDAPHDWNLLYANYHAIGISRSCAADMSRCYWTADFGGLLTAPMIQWTVTATATVLPTPVLLPYNPEADLNQDGRIDIYDLSILGNNFGQRGTNLAGDMNHDGVIDIYDLSILGSVFGRTK
jgi:uncharacterized protein YkwD